MVERRVTMLTERLQLTATQSASIRGILLDEHTRLEALRPQRPDSASRGQRTRGDSATRAQRPERPDSAARAQGRAQMEAIHQATDARVASVLTEEQRTAYQALVAERRERGEGGRGRGGRGGPGRGGFDKGGRQAPPPAVR